MDETTRKPRDVPVTWKREHEYLLFDLWEKNLSRIKESKGQKEIFSEMALHFADAGFDVGWKKIKSKTDNLLRAYRQELKTIRETGGLPSTWPHFKRLHKIVGSKSSKNSLEEMRAKAKNKPYKMRSDDEEFASITSSAESFIIESSEDSCSVNFEKKSLKRNRVKSPEQISKKTGNTQEMTPFELAMIEVVKERTEDLRRAATERLNVMSRFLDSTIEFQNKTLEIISKNQ